MKNNLERDLDIERGQTKAHRKIIGSIQWERDYYKDKFEMACAALRGECAPLKPLGDSVNPEIAKRVEAKYQEAVAKHAKDREAIENYESLRAALAQAERDKEAEREAHAALQSRCFEGQPTGESIFDQVKELKQQRDALRRDAERYRWLRNVSCIAGTAVDTPTVYDKWSLGSNARPLFEETLDAAIDAEIAALATASPSADLENTAARKGASADKGAQDG